MSTVQHVVLMKLKSFSHIEKELLASIDDLKTIDGVLELQFGENFSERSAGYNYALRVLFKDKDSLDKYAAHPTHEIVISKLIPIIVDGQVAVADWFTNAKL